jgi:ubiquinone/menaquinone biosynthesis C-methylase UbiE
MPIFNRLFYNRYRREAMSDVAGRLLIVGLGPGADLMFLPPAVTTVAAVEPEAAFRRTASALARRHGIAVDVVDGFGESIPFPDNSFDSVHVGLVLCSVDDVAATLGEIRRVLVPGGRLVVLEHVRGDGAMGRMRSHRGTKSAAETPTGANASIGETLYTWRAAIAAATTLASTVATTAAGSA